MLDQMDYMIVNTPEKALMHYLQYEAVKQISKS